MITYRLTLMRMSEMARFKKLWLWLLLYSLLPVVEAGVWDCTTNPVAQVVVGNGGSNSYSTILSWDFAQRTFTTTVCELSRI